MTCATQFSSPFLQPLEPTLEAKKVQMDDRPSISTYYIACLDQGPDSRMMTLSLEESRLGVAFLMVPANFEATTFVVRRLDFSGDKGSAASLGYAMLRINDLFVKELEEDAKFK